MKNEILKICIGIIFLITAFLAVLSPIFSFFSFLISYLVLGLDIIIKAFKSLVKKNIMDENLLMVIASLGAFLLGQYAEGVAVLLFYRVGEMFNFYAVKKSKKSLKEISSIRPDYVNLMVDGRPESRDPEDIAIGDTIMIKAGEKIPLDCTVQYGNSSVDNSVLTGESIPIPVKSGDELLSGGINLTGTLIATVKSEYGESTIAKIISLLENAPNRKSYTETFITKFAKYYTPTIIILAILIAILPTIILQGLAFKTWFYRALLFLVVSCPCALVISVPLSFFCGIGRASQKGILIKGSNYIEGLSTADVFVFDKTGTLTKGMFSVNKVVSIGINDEKFLELASYAEIHSNHPIAMSIKRFYDKELDESRVTDTEILAGYGVKSIVDKKTIHLGSAKLMELIGVDYKKAVKGEGVVHMAVDNEYCGYAVVSDKIRDEAVIIIRKLYDIGIKFIGMLTGDSKEIGERVADDLGIDYVSSELLPEDKVNEIKKISKKPQNQGSVVFVGDGINDAPVIAEADVGVAMGACGCDLAVETADVVIMDDNLSKIVDAVELSKFIMSVAKQNIVVSLGVKFSILMLSVIGLTNMWGAVFADVGVSILVIINSLRIFKK